MILYKNYIGSFKYLPCTVFIIEPNNTNSHSNKIPWNNSENLKFITQKYVKRKNKESTTHFGQQNKSMNCNQSFAIFLQFSRRFVSSYI